MPESKGKKPGAKLSPNVAARFRRLLASRADVFRRSAETARSLMRPAAAMVVASRFAENSCCRRLDRMASVARVSSRLDACRDVAADMTLNGVAVPTTNPAAGREAVGALVMAQ